MLTLSSSSGRQNERYHNTRLESEQAFYQAAGTCLSRLLARNFRKRGEGISSSVCTTATLQDPRSVLEWPDVKLDLDGAVVEATLSRTCAWIPPVRTRW